MKRNREDVRRGDPGLEIEQRYFYTRRRDFLCTETASISLSISRTLAIPITSPNLARQYPRNRPLRISHNTYRVRQPMQYLSLGHISSQFVETVSFGDPGRHHISILFRGGKHLLSLSARVLMDRTYRRHRLRRR
ncbi:hypothetical protein QCA50_019585 [Cerrena zonata]|uniref:Uncharacterized protein n=1 Tax=Cerrena zonata TaxID=2478898 RepID=A0AAW0FJS8_9APHY